MEQTTKTSKLSKLVKGLTGTLHRQKTFGKDRGTAPSVHVATVQPEIENRPNSCVRLPLPPPPVVDTIYQLPYYHPHLTSKDDLTNFMSQYSLQEGYFLLRKSFKSPTSYTITVNHRFGLKHIRVDLSNGQFSLKNRSFDTMDELIQFYSHWEIPNEENIPGILLRFPIRRPPIEFGEYIVVSKPGKPTSSTSPILKTTGLEGPQERRPQPPPPRPPATLPRGIGGTSSSTTLVGDQTKLLPVAPPIQETVPSADVLLMSFANDTTPSTCYDTISSNPIGPPSSNDTILSSPIGPPLRHNPNLSTSGTVSSKTIASPSRKAPTLPKNDTVSVKPIGPLSSNDTVLSMPIGPLFSQRAEPSAAPLDAFQNERCDCGLLIREASLPLGWSVHISQDSDTKDQPFFLSPDNETNWNLPFPVALHLSPEQQDLIRSLGFVSDIKAAGHHPIGLTSSQGCSSKTKGSLGGATTPKTWVPCNDYESSKSLQEAMERQATTQMTICNIRKLKELRKGRERAEESQ